MNITWNEIFEASITELTQLECQLLTFPNDPQVNSQIFYVRVLISFFRHDPNSIQKWINESNISVHRHQLLHLANLRLQIRSNLNLDKVIKWMKSFDDLDSSIEFRAEARFVSAMALQNLKRFSDASQKFKEASALYQLSGAEKKSLRALLSSLASYSCEVPESRLFGEYNAIFIRAIKINESQTAATALLNISREFQRLSGLDLALEYVRKAEDLYFDKHFGSREHGLCLIHKAHILFQLKREFEAKRSLAFAQNISHPEVQSAAEILSDKYNVELKTMDSKSILPTWQERQKETALLRGIGKHESKLLQLISTEPKDKFQLMDSLYGDKIDFLSKENRFKNLLSRIRRRHPGLLVLENDMYSISDPSLSDPELKKVIS